MMTVEIIYDCLYTIYKKAQYLEFSVFNDKAEWILFNY